MSLNDYLIKLKNDNFVPKNILDIGANVGDFSKLCRKIFPESYILMIEGNDNCEEDLKSINIDYKIALLGDSNRRVDFHINPKNLKCTGSSYYKEITHHYDNSIVVEKYLERLDDIVDKEFDLIKIDTQGSELDVIKGGLNVIDRSKYIIVEISLLEYNLASPLYDDVVNFMFDLGFKNKEIIEEHKWSDKGLFEVGETFQVDIIFYK